MTLLEIAAKARWESRAAHSGYREHDWEDFSEAARRAHIEDMRAALTALAESENELFPRSVEVDDGNGTILLFAPEDHADFKAMLRTIAETKETANDTA